MRKLMFFTCLVYCSSIYAADLMLPEKSAPIEKSASDRESFESYQEPDSVEIPTDEEEEESPHQEGIYINNHLEESRVERKLEDTKLEDKRLQEERLQRQRLDTERERQRATNKWIEERAADRRREDRRIDQRRWEETQRR